MREINVDVAIQLDMGRASVNSIREIMPLLSRDDETNIVKSMVNGLITLIPEWVTDDMLEEYIYDFSRIFCLGFAAGEMMQQEVPGQSLEGEKMATKDGDQRGHESAGPLTSLAARGITLTTSGGVPSPCNACGSRDCIGCDGDELDG